jgi:hypothetical protein
MEGKKIWRVQEIPIGLNETPKRMWKHVKHENLARTTYVTNTDNQKEMHIYNRRNPP